jgi:hypothetical protein
MAAMKNDLNVPLLITIGVVGALLLVVAALAVDGWYKSFEAEEIDAKWEQSPNTWLANLRDQQQANLVESHRIPGARPARYKLSIDDAMRVVVSNDGKLSG